MKAKMKLAVVLAAGLVSASLVSCVSSGNEPKRNEPIGNESIGNESIGNESKENETNQSETQISSGTSITKDREGNPITLPESIERIISMGPSNTEVISALGLGENIIAADSYSYGIPGIPEDIPMFSMMTPDAEQIINLEPDVVFITGMSKVGGEDPLKSVSDAGVCIVYIPSANSIEGIKEDIRFMADVLDAEEAGDGLISNMETEINVTMEAAKAVIEPKSVYFEISAAPNMYSFGTGVFLNEMLGIIGAENILADQELWVSVGDEAILEKNPDVILTSVNYIDDPVSEIISRPGWSEITAVKNGDVYIIDTDSSNRPSHNIIKALKEMAEAVHPEVFTN